ncbi:uncharacterized protein LOC142504512 [Primulina tabacum]|uniref:uncharacterized protein LOC142504512 n=1 Tax=Primulina tabacum TaxID=48773 RepID=UPI003F59A899
MKIKSKNREQENYANIIKSVAQAWHGHSSSPVIESTSEFDAHRLRFQSKPTRFKVQASREVPPPGVKKWDFAKSLWDSYEIVNVSRKLERCLLNMDDPFSESNRVKQVLVKRGKESRNSLRNLFKTSSRRFSEVDFSSDRG